MILKPDNDVYQGDLATLNTRKHAWSSAEKSSSAYRTASWIVLVLGFMCIIYIYTRVKDDPTMMGQLPLHVSIWITAISAMLVSRQGKKTSQQPFAGFHMAHFKVDDDTLYYQFQKGMSLRTYYIKDDDIRSISRDDKFGVILIEGNATINIEKRSSEFEEKVNNFYALVPFDKFDLDDLLKPYGKKVKNADGKLRDRFSEERR